MRVANLVTGRRLLVVLEPGDDVIASIAHACVAHQVSQATISTFSGAFRSLRIIAAPHPARDPEPPLDASVDIPYCEGIGSGTITSTDGGEPVVHLHVAVGVKDHAGAGYAGHVLSGQTHYVAEVVLDEVIAPRLQRRPHAGSFGIPILSF